MSKDFNADFLQGIFRLHDNFIMLLDVDKVFTEAGISSIKEIRQTAEDKLSL